MISASRWSKKVNIFYIFQNEMCYHVNKKGSLIVSRLKSKALILMEISSSLSFLKVIFWKINVFMLKISEICNSLEKKNVTNAIYLYKSDITYILRTNRIFICGQGWCRGTESPLTNESAVYGCCLFGKANKLVVFFHLIYFVVRF